MASIKLGIRELVEFVLRSGDLNPQTDGSHNTAQMGARIHKELQTERLAAHPDYQKEVGLKIPVMMNGQEYSVHGRADGIFTTDETVHIEEIKTSGLAFEDVPESTLALYWGQAKVYGYLLMKERELTAVTLQLTHYQVEDDAITVTEQVLTLTDAETFFQQLIDEYEAWLILRADLRKQRDESINALAFPYPEYRNGQHELAVAVYKTIMLKKQLLVEAPTGTGKTISTLFPTIKAMGTGLIQRTFYLTAKQSTRRVAEDALALMATDGLALKSITLTAKETITFPEEADVLPVDNPFMLGYYDRLKPALMDILAHENQLTRAVIETYARKYTLDPFEFSLDASVFCDVIICDYNYLFDPQVYLQRFFSDADEDNFFLVDEVHNLVNRAREMYSITVTERAVLALKPLYKSDRRFHRQVNALARTFKDFKQLLTEQHQEELVSQPELTTFSQAVERFVLFLGRWLPKHPDDNDLSVVLDLYFACLNYLHLCEEYGPMYRTRIFKTNQGVAVRLVCLDPSSFLNRSLHLGRGAVLFSATVSPLAYYQRVLGVDQDGLTYQLPSPFVPEHQEILVTDYLQTTYRERTANQAALLASIEALIDGQTGNYLIFFPSYGYLETVATAFEQAHPTMTIIRQTVGMTGDDRDAFLAEFQAAPAKSLVGFAVLGGIFSEGIDLPADRLIGVGIVSVGLPGLNSETDLIKDYFNGNNGRGFEFAYQLPGFNNVLQAAGRLIRSRHDRGIVVLMDQRFAQPRYRQIFPQHWQHWQQVGSVQQLTAQIATFWQREG
ncbi:ATP-dependent DNA helicase [Furfurilactobacillus sp. WILCCON 0119]